MKILDTSLLREFNGGKKCRVYNFKCHGYNFGRWLASTTGKSKVPPIGSGKRGGIAY